MLTVPALGRGDPHGDRGAAGAVARAGVAMQTHGVAEKEFVLRWPPEVVVGSAVPASSGWPGGHGAPVGGGGHAGQSGAHPARPPVREGEAARARECGRSAARAASAATGGGQPPRAGSRRTGSSELLISLRSAQNRLRQAVQAPTPSSR